MNEPKVTVCEEECKDEKSFRDKISEIDMKNQDEFGKFMGELFGSVGGLLKKSESDDPKNMMKDVFTLIAGEERAEELVQAQNACIEMNAATTIEEEAKALSNLFGDEKLTRDIMQSVKVIKFFHNLLFKQDLTFREAKRRTKVEFNLPDSYKIKYELAVKFNLDEEEIN